jgi:CRP/FNR family transcriptional regulator
MSVYWLPLIALEAFLAATPVRKFSKDELLVQQDEPMRQTYVVKAGAVRCYDISLDGNQQLIWLATEGEFFPISAPLETDETAPFFYSAFVDSEVYVVNRRRLALFLRANPGTMLDMYATMTRRLTDLQSRINAVAKPKAREKILHTLAFMADRFKTRRTAAGLAVEVALPLTHQDIADLVGLTRETTTATLKSLRDEGYVEYDRRHFLIRRDKIRQVL